MDKLTDRMPVPTDRALRIMKWVVIIAALAFAIYLLVTMAQLSQSSKESSQDLVAAEQDRERLEDRVDVLEQDVDQRDSAVRTANKRLKNAGEKPVVVPQQPVSVPKVDGQPVLTSDDVLTLIEAEVRTQHPDLTSAQKRALTDAAAVKAAARIPPPKDGRDGPSLEDLRPIVRTEVAKIPVPADGTDGQDGTDGSTPTAEDVAAALTALCGGTCKGDKGDPGATGATGPVGKDGAPGKDGSNGSDGAPGRGITSVTCHVDGTWTFTWTDGTTSTVSGPCRVAEPEPTPTDPTPSPTSSEPSPTGTPPAS